MLSQREGKISIKEENKSSFVTNPGGIDLNSNEKLIEQSGKQMKMRIPQDSIEWQNSQTNGFIPVIINIGPPTSLPLLLGAGTPNQSSEPMNVSSLN